MRSSLALSLLLAGCGETIDAVDAAAPDEALLPICSADELGDAGVPATFTNVEKIFDRVCANGVCHYPGFSVPGGAGLDLTHGHAYADIVGKIAADPPNQCGGVIVEPARPDESYLMVKLTTPTGRQCNPQGEQMPVCETGSCPLPACEIDLVRRWILAGALDD